MGPMRLTKMLSAGALVALWCAAASGGASGSEVSRLEVIRLGEDDAERTKQLVGLAVELGREYNRHKADQGTGIRAQVADGGVSGSGRSIVDAVSGWMKAAWRL